ncbi:uncharacterized protein EI97DRAFT_454063 [Westerdykella ornata]|uniref:Uncharacterized protein n=1 Tax=Westerdykella ornata TaxID=318751 RepID=A0A6A6JW23_WESOR|nr:uncharacterized protein EI97DRAFT_454063 [Westerdykella ornata]KAF2280820.1 hypothetical protein EI97DRAFT_454063 [Westerdykella ornata]
MCLVKVRQEEDVVVPYRTVVRTRSRSPHHRTSRRVSRVSVVRESRPASSSYVNVVRPPSSSYVAVPTPKPLAIPAPQPVPVFVQPSPPPTPPPPPSHHHHHHTTAHYVHVSPRSSISSSPSRSDYVMHEREYRRERERRDYSPDSPRHEHYRYVRAPPSESDHYERFTLRERSRSRGRSQSRDYAYDPRDSYRETRERVVIVDGDGRRRREYRD